MNDAAWALVGVVVGVVVTGVFQLVSQNRLFAHERDMFRLRNQGVEMVKALLSEMLNHRSYTDRSFSALKKAVGGYDNDKIRQLLHAVGAKKAGREDGDGEWWYLTSRQEERIAKKRRDA